MMKAFLLLFFPILYLSCDSDIDRIYAFDMVGNYDTHLNGYSDYFETTIAQIDDHSLAINTYFDGAVYDKVVVTVRENNNGLDIAIPDQLIDQGVRIVGNGYYENGVFQLDYTMRFWGDPVNFTLVGTKQ